MDTQSIIENLPPEAGVLICGHGSRAKVAAEEFGLLAGGLQQRFPDLKVGYGFLEYSSPNIHMALDRLRSNCASSRPWDSRAGLHPVGCTTPCW